MMGNFLTGTRPSGRSKEKESIRHEVVRNGNLGETFDRFIELPDLAILNIALFLTNEELLCLSRTCKRLNTILPKILCITKENEVRITQTHGKHEHGHFGIDQLYFDSPPLPGHVERLEMSLYWKDQGWGNRKAFVFVHLIRREDAIATTSHSSGLFKGPAPHEYAQATCTLVDDVEVNRRNKLNCNGIVRLSQTGDRFRFLLNCGGGGGHSMCVKNFHGLIRSRYSTND